MRWSNALAISMVILTGCASKPPIPVIPVEALQDCPEPLIDKTTNGGLAKGVTDLRLALRQCNNDKLILREWAQPKD